MAASRARWRTPARTGKPRSCPLTGTLGIRSHVAAPIVTSDGRVFGTVCAYAHRRMPQVESALGVVKAVARALATVLERAEEG